MDAVTADVESNNCRVTALMWNSVSDPPYFNKQPMMACDT